jgi:hypothetical protein
MIQIKLPNKMLEYHCYRNEQHNSFMVDKCLFSLLWLNVFRVKYFWPEGAEPFNVLIC